jgi:hypothetical protein
VCAQYSSPNDDLHRASKEQQRQDVEERKKNVKQQQRRGKRQTRGKIVNENFFQINVLLHF